MKILFWLYRSKTNSNGLTPIWVRFTINGNREQFSAGVLIKPDQWNAKRQIIKGRGEEVEALNKTLQNIRMKLRTMYSDLLLKNENPTARNLKDAFLNRDEPGKKLLETFRFHNDRIKSLIGKDFSKATYVLYTRTEQQVSDFIWYRYKRKDFYLNDLKRSFVEDFIHYLKTCRDHQTNTVYKNYTRLMKVINMALDHGWLDKNPFQGFRIKKEKKDIVFLTEEELLKIETKELSIERVSVVRDLFVLQCYTGIAYQELKNLTASNIQRGIDGELWIVAVRQKTGRSFKVPLLPKAMEIINKYKTLSLTPGKKLLPVPSNQRFNSYLKEIADVCGISKQLHTHMARKTFASTVTLLNGLSLEVVSAILGHTNTSQTLEAYGQITEQKISREMNQLKQKLSGQSTK